MTWNTQELISLGAGGSKPRLDLIHPEDLSRVTATYPSVMGSIYAFDFAPDGYDVVVGTRNGNVHSLRRIDPASSQACEWSVRTLPHRVAGVTQLLWPSMETVCILNESGAGWCCNPNNDSSSMSLMATGHRKLVALCRVGNNGILGFAEDGALLLWRNGEWDSPECLQQISLCRNSLHARPILWSDADAVIYSSPDRRLTVLDTAGMESSRYTLEPCIADCFSADENVLLTIDAKARRGRLWDIHFKPIRSIDGLPADLIQCVLLDAEGTSMLAVDRAGDALLLDISADRSHLVSQLPGSDYRVCAVQPRRIRRAAQEQRIRNEATRAAHEALVAMKRGETTQNCLEILDAAGYRHVSRALRAVAAEKDNDIAEAIRLTRRQVESLPPDAPSATGTLQRYHRLLAAAGLLALYGRAESSQPNMACAPDRSGTCMVSSDSQNAPYLEVMTMPCTMEILCECASAAGISVAGCWHIKSLPTINCGETHVTPVQFSTKYNNLKKARLWHPPIARLVTVHCNNTSFCSIRQAVFFQTTEECSMHLLLSFDSKNGFSTVEPIVVFRPSSISDGLRIAEYNARALADFHHLMNSDATKARLTELIRTSTHILRRIITESQSLCSRKVEIK